MRGMDEVLVQQLVGVMGSDPPTVDVMGSDPPTENTSWSSSAHRMHYVLSQRSDLLMQSREHIDT